MSKPLNKNVHIILQSEIRDVLKQEGLSTEQISAIINSSIEKFMDICSMGDGKVYVLSAKEMEDQLSGFDILMDAVNPPKELNPVDLYYRSKSAANDKFTILEARKNTEKHYAVLHSYISAKLAQYRRKLILEERKSALAHSIKNTRNIFIIHGHNEAKLLELEKMLKNSFNLTPIVLKDQPDQGLTIIEKFEKYAAQCSYAFALFTPDDIITTDDGQQYFQARPNVIFELGWFYANLGRSRVCVLEQSSEKSKIFSDLQGVLRIQFNNSISESYVGIKRELESVGII